MPSAVESFVGWINPHFPWTKDRGVCRDDGKTAFSLVVERIKKAYSVKESVEVPEALAALERYVVINAIDHHWQEHLTEMEELRRSIGLRSYGQKDPLQEYKSEAYRYFEELMNNVRLQICTGLFRSTTNLQSFENMLSILSRSARLQGPGRTPVRTAPNCVAGPGAGRAPRPAPPTASTPVLPPAASEASKCPFRKPSPQPASAEPEIQLPRVTVRRETPKVGRNDPCPCGSGKKFKQCHGK